MAADYTVLTQDHTTSYDARHKLVQVVRVDFKITSDGQTGFVDIPATQYNADNAAAAIQTYVDTHNKIAGL